MLQSPEEDVVMKPFKVVDRDTGVLNEEALQKYQRAYTAKYERTVCYSQIYNFSYKLLLPLI